MMASMAGMLWLRRLMIVATILALGFTVHYMYQHGFRNRWLGGLNILSAVISIGFVYYSLDSFGW
ncbi:hypothetical protein [Brevibacillus dissolubilis]|uniref:hypothetical protein n=1 Tax=Brevibacillus dissolubilis TaxID=1844116 RepID=UPI001115FDA7|nr:hypothetical protein [Brevibacillus dissolubilis]